TDRPAALPIFLNGQKPMTQYEKWMNLVSGLTGHEARQNDPQQQAPKAQSEGQGQAQGGGDSMSAMESPPPCACPCPSDWAFGACCCGSFCLASWPVKPETRFIHFSYWVIGFCPFRKIGRAAGRSV